MITRRRFIQAATAAAAAPYIVPASARGADGAVAPSNRIATAIIGAGGMNGGHHGTLLGMKQAMVTAVCDPQYARREAAKKRTESAYAARQPSGEFKGCIAFGDFRELLQRKDIDAVFVATPDHWHAPISIAAAAAGKDIYCEKPMTDTVAAGQALIRAVRRYGRILQVGQQQRSDGRFRTACELVRNGRIGKLQRIQINVPGGWDSGAVPKPQPVPADVDWEMWLGPARWTPYSPQRISNSYWWHCYDYGIGFQAGWGVHHTDIAQWGSGTEDTGPAEAEGTAVFPKDGICDTPIDWKTEFTYANGLKILFMSGGENVTFEGTEGKVHVSRSRIDAEPKSLLQEKLGPNDIHLYFSRHHIENFLDCVKTRKEPIVPVEIGHKANLMCMISDVAIRLGRKVKWDPATERFIDDEQANRYLSRAMRAPWHL